MLFAYAVSCLTIASSDSHQPQVTLWASWERHEWSFLQSVWGHPAQYTRSSATLFPWWVYLFCYIVHYYVYCLQLSVFSTSTVTVFGTEFWLGALVCTRAPADSEYPIFGEIQHILIPNDHKIFFSSNFWDVLLSALLCILYKSNRHVSGDVAIIKLHGFFTNIVSVLSHSQL